MSHFGKSGGSSCLSWVEEHNHMTQNPAQLYLHINRLHQKCKLQSEEIVKAYDNCADNKRSNICIAEGFKLSSVSGNSFFMSKMWKRQVYASLTNDRQILSIFLLLLQLFCC